MLRFHFSSDDLARVRIASAPDPLWEILLSAHLVNQRSVVAPFGPWRERVLAGLRPASRMLLSLAPPRGYSPDFLTPAGCAGDFESGLDAVLSTSRTRLRRDIARLPRTKQANAWARDLAAGSPPALRGLGAAMRAHYEHAVEPYWNGIRAAVDVDRTVRTRAWIEGGTERALRTLHPSIRWERPVLSVATAADREVDLAGRGLTIIPSYFCARAPISLADPEMSPVLLYPIAHDVAGARNRAWAGVDDGRSLIALLGRTRASVLRTLGTGATTSEIAQRLEISPASASEHATVLRNAGLIASGRERNMVVHTLTRLGSALLEGSDAQPLAGAGSTATASSALSATAAGPR